MSDKDFSITLNAYFNVKWRDPRLLVSKDYTKEGPPPKVISKIEPFQYLNVRRFLPKLQSEVTTRASGAKKICKFQNLGDENPSLTPINLHILRNLWLPDVEILDLKAFETHSVLSKLEGKDQIKRLEIL